MGSPVPYDGKDRFTETKRLFFICPRHYKEELVKALRCILLVEDDPMVIELTLTALPGHNLANEVMVARDGVEVLDYLYRRGSFAQRLPGNPVAILHDLKMPRLALRPGPFERGPPPSAEHHITRPIRRCRRMMKAISSVPCCHAADSAGRLDRQRRKIHPPPKKDPHRNQLLARSERRNRDFCARQRCGIRHGLWIQMDALGILIYI